MRNAALTATIALAALILLAPSGGAQDGVLLSDNGLGNVQFSEYGDAPRLYHRRLGCTEYAGYRRGRPPQPLRR